MDDRGVNVGMKALWLDKRVFEPVFTSYLLWNWELTNPGAGKCGNNSYEVDIAVVFRPLGSGAEVTVES